MTTDEAAALRGALRALLLSHGVLDEHRRPCGATLSAPAAYTLIDLLAAPEGLSVGELSARLQIDRTNVSRLCQRLEGDGLCSRATASADARRCIVRLTPRGRALAEGVEARSLAHHRAVVAALGTATLAVLDALHTLEPALREVRASGPPTPLPEHPR